MPRALWLMPGYGYSDKEKYSLGMAVRKAGINPSEIFYVSLAQKCKANLIKQRTKTIQILDPEHEHAARIELDKVWNTIKPDVVVCNDLASLWLITGSGSYSLNLCRGSTYLFHGVPVVVIDSLANRINISHGDWVFLNDLAKIKRWMEKKQRAEPKFIYSVCRTLADVVEAVSFLRDSHAISLDIETKQEFITCIGYTGLVRGVLKSFVIPFFNSTKEDGCHWADHATEVAVWELVRDLHDCPNIKIAQNGTYDVSYFIRYRVPLRNYTLDTLHIFHSIWCEAPKKLNFIASIFLDHMRYWKDEMKGAKEDSFGDDADGLERYWRYNALDCYYTFLSARIMATLIILPPMAWALKNYNTEFRMSVGPCLWASMQGMSINLRRQRRNNKKFLADSEAALIKMKLMVDDENFNPGSPPQVASLLYDVLRVEPIKMRGKKDISRSTDEKFLELIGEKNTFANCFIQQIFQVKKPLNNASKYGSMAGYNDRFIYNLSAAGTETGRLASQSHAFWYGTNAQNVPTKIRDMFVADEGCVLFEMDYSQSDAKFVAFESEDPKYMATMVSGKDTHSIHAAHFFKMAYEVIYAAAQADEEWATHPTKGVRNITKRAVHGSNFQMQAGTLLVQMKREPVVAAAKVMGFPDAGKWTQAKLVQWIDRYLIEEYHKLYPGLRPWFASSATEAQRNGNKATCAFGRTRLFFGDLGNNPGTRRELSAYFGQGGTAGNINRVMLELFYKRRDLIDRGLQLLLQVHDSLLFQAPIQHAEKLIEQIRPIMEAEFQIKGRTLNVSTDVKAGFSWGEGCIKMKGGLLDWDKMHVKEAQINARYDLMKDEEAALVA